jgi:predicted O-methyltransferase YrrM
MDFDYRINSAAFDLLRPSHTLYVTTVTTPDIAISLEMSSFVWTLCEMYSPRVMVDLGSGYSSFMLRMWAGLQEQRSLVVSIDDNEEWLKKSIKFCEDHHKNTDGFLMHSDTRVDLLKGIDFVLHRFGNLNTRKATLKYALSLLNHDGLILLDDIHKYHYADYVTKLLSSTELVHLDVERLTRDSFGRYGVLYSYNPHRLPHL